MFSFLLPPIHTLTDYGGLFRIAMIANDFLSLRVIKVPVLVIFSLRSFSIGFSLPLPWRFRCLLLSVLLSKIFLFRLGYVSQQFDGFPS